MGGGVAVLRGHGRRGQVRRGQVRRGQARCYDHTGAAGTAKRGSPGAAQPARPSTAKHGQAQQPTRRGQARQPSGAAWRGTATPTRPGAAKHGSPGAAQPARPSTEQAGATRPSAAQPSAVLRPHRRGQHGQARPSTAKHSSQRGAGGRGAVTLRAWPRASFRRLVQACQRSTAPRPPAGPWSPSGTTSTSVSATVADRISASSARAGSGVLTPMARAWERCTAT